jgi:Mesyanzhinovviridae Dda-like helicase
MSITLTDHQAAGIAAVAAWYEQARDGFAADVFRWFGYAGTGKTFTAARIPEALGLTNVVFGTYTGKAASVLRRSLAKYGALYPVTTIHSAIYYPTTSAEARKALEEARARADYLEVARFNEDDDAARDEMDKQAEAIRESLPQLEANAKRLRWEFNPESDWASAQLIVLDEVSMVNAKLAADIESYGVPILVLGDPAQLPPVEGGGYYTEAEPDWLLTEVQRAALDSPVTMLATRIRESTSGTLGLTDEDMQDRSLAAALEHDQVLCWTNKRRWSMVKAIRARRDLPPGAPAAGDRIMVLTNNKDMAVFNGEQFEVLGIVSEGTLGPTLSVRTETGLVRDLPVFAEGFHGLEQEQAAKKSAAGMRGNRALATFAQAITVHKSQGSEWPSVYVVNETPGMISMATKREGRAAAVSQARRWLYTAVTRASDKVTITEAR